MVKMSQISDKELENDLRGIISTIVEIESVKITLDASFVEDLGMDSMMALEILAAIERKYKIQIPEDKLTRLKNLGESIKLTKEYLSR
jgi:acyl carrier protein